jgi:uncharacterized CHY-type Zn-finger protein
MSTHRTYGVRLAVSPIHRINDHSCVYHIQGSNEIVQLGLTGTQQNYARYACNKGLECFGVFIPMVPRNSLFCGIRRQRLVYQKYIHLVHIYEVSAIKETFT